MSGHNWIIVRYDGTPSGSQNEWRCKRCKTETKLWKRPEDWVKIWMDDPKTGRRIGYTCEELLVREVHES